MKNQTKKLKDMNTKLGRAERRLHVSEDKYRQLVENVACIILRMDKNGRITLLNIKSLKGGMMKLKADDNAPVIQLQFSSGEEKDILSRFQTKPAIPPSDHISSRRIAKVYPV